MCTQPPYDKALLSLLRFRSPTSLPCHPYFCSLCLQINNNQLRPVNSVLFCPCLSPNLCGIKLHRYAPVHKFEKTFISYWPFSKPSFNIVLLAFALAAITLSTFWIPLSLRLAHPYSFHHHHNSWNSSCSLFHWHSTQLLLDFELVENWLTLQFVALGCMSFHSILTVVELESMQQLVSVRASTPRLHLSCVYFASLMMAAWKHS